MLFVAALSMAVAAIALIDLFDGAATSSPNRRQARLRGRQPLPPGNEASPIPQQPIPDRVPDEAQSAAPESDPDAETPDSLTAEAIQVVQRLVESYPDNPDVIGPTGDMYLALGCSKKAAQCWTRCIELQPERVDGYRSLARMSLVTGEHEKVAKLSRQLLEIDPTARDVHRWLAQALIGSGNPQEAVAALQEEIRISPGVAANHFFLGQAHQQLSHYAEAKEHYLVALRLAKQQLAPEYDDALYGLAIVCARLGQKEEASEYQAKFQEARSLQWEHHSGDRDQPYDSGHSIAVRRRSVARTYTAVGILYQKLENTTAAEKLWRRAAALDPADRGCRENLALLYRRQRRDTESLQTCEQLCEIAPNHAPYHFNIGILYAEMNRPKDAISAIEKAAKLEPGNARIQQTLRQLRNRR